MPRISDETRAARRTQILEAALELFAQRGFEGTSMADIIEAADSSAGAVYGHFKNKGDLVRSAVEGILVRRTVELEEALAQGRPFSPAALVEHFVGQSRNEVASPALLLQVWASASAEPAISELANHVAGEIIELFEHHLAAWHLAAGADATTAEALGAEQARACMGLCQGYLLQWALLTDFDGDAYLAGARALLPA